jgi:hypothetical protein
MQQVALEVHHLSDRQPGRIELREHHAAQIAFGRLGRLTTATF